MADGFVLPYSRLRESSHPDMPVALVVTASDETVEVQVHTSVRDDGGISVGYPVRHRADGAVLVELPDEVLGGPHMGSRRIWVWPSKLRSKPTTIEALQATLAAMTADRDAERGRADRAEAENVKLRAEAAIPGFSLVVPRNLPTAALRQAEHHCDWVAFRHAWGAVLNWLENYAALAARTEGRADG